MILVDAMEVILIDQNKSDSFLMKYFLDEINLISSVQEFDDYGEALDYLNEKATAPHLGQLLIICNEEIKVNKGADFLAFISGEFPELNMYRVLTGENRANAEQIIQSTKIDAFLEKKIDLDEFGQEIKRVILNRESSSQFQDESTRIKMHNNSPTTSVPANSISQVGQKFHIKSIIPTCVFRLFAAKP